jgi:hypothetical protein
MKTRVTIHTTPDQEMMIGLKLTGHATKATQAQVREYFEDVVEMDIYNLDVEVKETFGRYRKDAVIEE